MSETSPLAVVGSVTNLSPIPGADFIQRVEVDCGASGQWSGVAGKDLETGEAVTVFLPDAVLPPNERWAFMEKSKWRVRMARFKGCPSEVLIVKGAPTLPVGTDLTAALGVTKYEKPLKAELAGDAAGWFPTFIPKTDEPNFQKAGEFLERAKTEPWYITEKADGSSCTAFVDDVGLHVCSRNLELKEFTASGTGNAYWRTARRYGMERLPMGVALQFEIVGPSIQKNPLDLSDVEARAFSLYSITERRYLPRRDLVDLCDSLAIPMARLIAVGEGKPPAEDADGYRALAAIKYPNGKDGEGVVIRAQNSTWSFKAINLAYKD